MMTELATRCGGLLPRMFSHWAESGVTVATRALERRADGSGRLRVTVDAVVAVLLFGQLRLLVRRLVGDASV